MSSLAPAPSLFCPHHKSSTPRIVAPQSHIISTPSSAATATSSLAPPHSAFSSVDLHKLGIYTSLPTPASTPEFVNLSALRHSESPNSTDNDFTHVASCSSNLSTVHQQRPVHLRASTLPNVMDNRDGQDRNVEQVDGSTQSISAVEVVVLGAKREVQSGGPAQGVKMERFTSPSVAKKVAKVAGSESSKDRFVNGLVCTFFLPILLLPSSSFLNMLSQSSSACTYLLSATCDPGACVFAIESIWGPSPTQPHSNSSVLPLHWFVKEVLRRSRTSCSTLQVALFYLHQIRRQIRHSVATAALHLDEFVELENALRLDQDIKGGVSPAAASTTAIGLHTAEMKLATATTIPEYPSPPASPTMMESRYAELLETQNSAILCGRRMFLAALISSSKYLQDRNYSNRAWSKISGLPALEINVNERMFLSLMEYQLFVSAESFQQCESHHSRVHRRQGSCC